VCAFAQKTRAQTTISMLPGSWVVFIKLFRSVWETNELSCCFEAARKVPAHLDACGPKNLPRAQIIIRSRCGKQENPGFLLLLPVPAAIFTSSDEAEFFRRPSSTQTRCRRCRSSSA